MSAERADAQRRAVAGFGYVFTPVIPLIVLGSANLRRDSYLRRHAAQALLWGVVLLLGFVLDVVLIVALVRASLWWLVAAPLLAGLPFLPGIFLGWRAWAGGEVHLPLITALARRLVPPS